MITTEEKLERRLEAAGRELSADLTIWEALRDRLNTDDPMHLLLSMRITSIEAYMTQAGYDRVMCTTHPERGCVAFRDQCRECVEDERKLWRRIRSVANDLVTGNVTGAKMTMSKVVDIYGEHLGAAKRG